MDRYKLPPTHDLFTSQSQSDVLLEMYEDLESQKRDLEQQLDEGTVAGESRRVMMERLATINKALLLEEPQDDLWDEWEEDLASGRAPDLEKGLE